MTSKPMCLQRQIEQKLLDKRYKNRSFLRPYLLGYSPNTYLKTGRICKKLAFSMHKCSLQAQTRPDLGIQSSQSRLITCASSYELNSFNKLSRLKG